MASRRLPPDENSGPTILGVIWAFTILDIFIVALRFYDRVHLRGGLGWDVSILERNSRMMSRD